MLDFGVPWCKSVNCPRPVEGLEDDDGRSERARCCLRQFELILCRHFLNSLELKFSKVPHDDLPPCSWASARLMAATSQENLRPFHFAGSWSSVGWWQFYPGARRGPLHHRRCKADADTAVAPSLQSCRRCRSALLEHYRREQRSICVVTHPCELSARSC